MQPEIMPAFRTALQCIYNFDRREEIAAIRVLCGNRNHIVQEAHTNSRHNRNRRREGHGIHVGGNHDHQDDQRQQQIDSGQQVAHPGQLILWNAL